MKLLEGVVFRIGEIGLPAQLTVETAFLLLLLVLATALAVDRWYDRPVRDWLAGRG